MATAYAGAGHPREARAQLAIPLKDATTLAGAAYLLGSLAREEGDTDAAIRHLRRVIELEPKSPEAHAELGSLLLGRDEVGAARRETELALAMDPRSYRANATLMKLYRDAHDPRLEAQVELLKKLAKEREAEFQLLHRTIEFQPR